MLKKIGNFLKQPLGTGILIVVVTSLFQQYGWKAQQRYLDEQWKTQQRYLNEQLNINATREQKHKFIDDITVAIGKLLTSYGIVAGAHREKVPMPQLSQILKQYNLIQREWDTSEDLLKLRMKTAFSDQKIQSDWSALLNKLGTLDSQVHRLNEFNTNDVSQTHEDQTALLQQTIKEAEAQLASMNQAMTDTVSTVP